MSIEEKLSSEVKNMVLDNLGSDLHSDDIKNETRLDEIPEWDSMGWVKIMNATQDIFNVDVLLEDAENIKTIDDLIQYISDKKKL